MAGCLWHSHLVERRRRPDAELQGARLKVEELGLPAGRDAAQQRRAQRRSQQPPAAHMCLGVVLILHHDVNGLALDAAVAVGLAVLVLGHFAPELQATADHWFGYH